MRLAWRRVVLGALVLVAVPFALLTSPTTSGAQSEVEGPVYEMTVTGPIDRASAPYVDRVVAAAEDDDAAALIIEIDTPGGRLDAVIQMRDAIIDADVRTVALIDSSAYSAGALVAIASEEIDMTPSAARQAFLLREVLGPPVSLRTDSGDRPN